MFKQLVAQSIYVAALILSGVLFNSAHAGITLEQIRTEIQDDGSIGRKIRPEIIPLKEVPVPEPSNLYDFIKNKKNAIELGKALFWDLQVGSDGNQACASCHSNAGADSRAKNQLNPGLRRVKLPYFTPDPDNTFGTGMGPNYHLSQTDFPLHDKKDPWDFTSEVLQNSNDIVSDQGVHYSLFDSPDFITDPDGFYVDWINVRRVSPRHAPSVINAVFNHRQFWDGRASNIFNGVNPFGDRDEHAFVYKAGTDTLEPVKIGLENASLASQALGPPVSSFEMSADGRTWIDIGHQFILKIRPLAKQKVHPEDSVLGELARGKSKGLNISSYKAMIKTAFKRKWWDSQKFVRINEDGSRTIVEEPGNNTFSQMEMNFSLFFGLAVQLYQATLVADNTSVDRYLEEDRDTNPYDTEHLTEEQLIGFFIADREGRCLNCHGGPEFTFASVSKIKGLTLEDGTKIFDPQGLTRIRKENLIDEGFNNIGVTPTLEDPGVGGNDPFGPLSFARLKHLGDLPASSDELAYGLGDAGAMKIPGLRNVALTAPYFHNGSVATLADLIDFYFRGGNFRDDEGFADSPLLPEEGGLVPDPNIPFAVLGFDKDYQSTGINGLGILTGPHMNSSGLPDNGLDEQDKDNLIAFLEALTDERVRLRKAPFDHPQLFVPNGHPGDQNTVEDQDSNGNADDSMIEIPAVGADGGAPLPTFDQQLDQ